MTDTVIIPRRYRGPSDSANGGYTCGLLARHVAGPARVRLHRPPPLDEALSLRVTDGSHVALLHSENVIAEGVPADSTSAVPGPVDIELAEQASQKYRWYSGHPFPGCFVCGPEREHGDGLCIFPGAIAERHIVAAPWTPDDSLCDASGNVQPEVVWAALDCPSWFGILEFESGVTYALLGQLAAHIIRRPSAQERCVVIGWNTGRDGRKLHGGAALYSREGELLGSSSATWIELKT